MAPSTDARPPGALPVPAMRDAVENARAIRVAASRGVEHGGALGRRYGVRLAAGVNDRPVGAQGDDQRLDVLGELRERNAGALREHASFVVVDRHVARRVDHGHELRAVEQRHALARVEDVRDARLRELRGMRAHAFLAVGCDDAKADVGHVGHTALMRIVHGARVKRRDLVVVEVGDDERLPRVRAGHVSHAVDRDAERREPLLVLDAVVADGRHHDGLAADLLQVVGDVARASAPLPAHLADLERHGEHMRLVGQDVP